MCSNALGGPTTSANLSPELNQLIAQELALGHYSSEAELLTEAVHLLRERNALRQQIQPGAAQLQNGEFTDYDPQSLRAVRRSQSRK